MYKPVWLDVQGRVEWRLGRVEQRLGRVEWLGRAEQRLSRAAEAVELCGVAELLGVPLTVCTNQCSWMHKAERCSGLVEWSGLAGQSRGLAEW